MKYRIGATVLFRLDDKDITGTVTGHYKGSYAIETSGMTYGSVAEYRIIHWVPLDRMPGLVDELVVL